MIEAIEARDPEEAFEVGVQWHPEKLADSLSERLFESFVHACRADAPSMELADG